MPAAVLGPVLGAAVTGTAGVIGAKMQTSANDKAAEVQAAAAKYAADLQSQSSDKQIALSEKALSQAESDFQQTQQANYGQWKAQQDRLGMLGVGLGLPARNTPAYVGPSSSLAMPRTAAPSPAAPQATSPGLTAMKAPQWVRGQDGRWTLA